MSNDISNWLSEFQDLNPESIDKESTHKKDHKLDLFRQVLPALDRGDKFFYRSLDEDQKKEISPWVLMRWMTSAADNKDQPNYLLPVNDFVNDDFTSLSPKKSIGRFGHPELQWMLLSLCGTNKSPRRKFMKPPKGVVKNRLEEEFMLLFPLLGDKELELLLHINSKEEIVEFFMNNGYDDKTIAELLSNNASKS